MELESGLIRSGQGHLQLGKVEVTQSWFEHLCTIISLTFDRNVKLAGMTTLFH